MNTLVLTVHNTGEAGCLYSELIDLSSLGPLEISRASVIEFNHQSQKWEVRLASQPETLAFTHVSREICLQWEREELQ